jgi:acyl carrier protein
MGRSSEMALSRDEIMEKVREALVDALGVDEDEVTPEARIGGDLGAESIDYLDIVFRLEKAFTIKIPRGDLFPDNILQSDEFVQDGKLTEKGLEELKSRLPHADLSEFEKNPNVDDIADLFTVDMIVRYIETKVNEQAG